MAAWTWMRYSYAWDVTPGMLYEGRVAGRAYVSIRGKTVLHRFYRPGKPEKAWLVFTVRLIDDDSKTRRGVALKVAEAERAGVEERTCWKGRVNPPGLVFPTAFYAVSTVSADGTVRPAGHDGAIVFEARIDTTASRFTGESVAGLVVGAMGCFIFGLYLRRWMRERRRPGGDTLRVAVSE
jgi:hypothetical protein